MSLITFLLKNSSCPIHLPITMPKTDSAASVSFVCSEKIQNCWDLSVVEWHFSKVRETSMFCYSVKKNQDMHGMCQKVMAFRDEILRSPLLTGVAGLQYSVCKAT